MTEPRVTRARPAGPDHQVVTVTGGKGGYCARPCPQCPWRVSNDGSFPPEAFRHSAGTAYDMATSTFACHMAGVDAPLVCAGFILGARHNLALRLKAALGLLDLGIVGDGGADLHPDYRAMAVANGVPPDDPVLALCR
jgi:hypothetical protein